MIIPCVWLTKNPLCINLDYELLSITNLLILCNLQAVLFYLEFWNGKWAIPEINGTPLKKTWDSQNFYSSFPVGIPKIDYSFHSHKGKEDMVIPNF